MKSLVMSERGRKAEGGGGRALSDAVCAALGNGLCSETNGQRSRTPFTCTH